MPFFCWPALDGPNGGGGGAALEAQLPCPDASGLRLFVNPENWREMLVTATGTARLWRVESCRNVTVLTFEYVGQLLQWDGGSLQSPGSCCGMCTRAGSWT
jgi:hypothetical protein